MLALFLAGAYPAQAQQPPVMHQSLIAWITAQKHAPADSLENFETQKIRRERFQALLKSMLEKDWANAERLARPLSYRLVTIDEAGNSFIVASDDRGLDPIVVISLRAARDVIIQAPHVPFERGTAEQAIILLKDLGARAAIISGAHRCASRSFTTCNGMTAVCSKDDAEGFRDSDAGHNTRTLFHLAHIALSQNWEDAVVISLHGMGNDNEGVVTSLVISNGIKADDDSGQTPATRLRYALAKTTAPGRVVSCNVKSDSKYNYRPLCGFTNVQGRHVNGDPDACNIGVTRGTGRFIHLEQDRSVLRPYFEDWSGIYRYPIPLALTRSLSEILPPIRER
jgi:hypothetical protein